MGSDAIDRAMMARCVKLAREGMAGGELPFGSVISRDGVILSESRNQMIGHMDQSRHAEIIAITQARRLLNTNRLDDCTIYSVVEPCPCARFASERHAFLALFTPLVPLSWGEWHDGTSFVMTHLRTGYLFRPAPEVLTGVPADEAQQAWSDWKPLVWRLMKLRNYLVVPETVVTRTGAAHQLPIWRRLALRLSTWWPQQLGPVD